MQRYETVPFSAVSLNSGFWRYRQQLNRESTVPAVRARFEDTGRFDAFRLAWREGMENKPHIFWDSDVAKWMEAVAYLLDKQPAPEHQALVEELIDRIEQGQGADGYFNIHFTNIEPAARFTKRWAHELYCAGHLIEAAVAYDEATGRDRFLRLMMKYADYIDRVFRVEQSASFQTPGHEELELALVRLYRRTGEARYLTLAKWFIDQRGQEGGENLNVPDWERRNNQSHQPVREMQIAEGHAVRMGYLFSGAADVARETGDEQLFEACRTVFHNIVTRRMYVTGGVGSTHCGEAYTVDYDLPNETAYTETCAAISLAYFARRMLSMQADSLYADVIETVLYNGFLASTSLDGKRFFYSNPLAISRRSHGRNRAAREGDWLPASQRVEVFSCSCCPPNIVRFVASVGEYLYTTGPSRLYVHQFAGSDARIPLDGREVRVRQETDYPLSGRVRLIVEGGEHLEVAVRIPGWCAQYSLSAEHTLENGYAVVRCPGSRFELTLDLCMQPELIEANPEVESNAGRAALRRGPVIYCLEEADNACTPHDLRIDPCLNAREEYDERLHMPVIRTRGWKRPAPRREWLYRPLAGELEETELTFIPYYAFGNRGESDMQVWTLVRQ